MRPARIPRHSGIAELARLRRQGIKATKHPPLEKEVRGGHTLRGALRQDGSSACTRTLALQPVATTPIRHACCFWHRCSNLTALPCPALPCPAQVYVSLPKLNAGCTKTVAVERRRVRPDGTLFTSIKNVHAVIR